MKKNEECEIVRDLLPSYLEKLTNEKTNEFIEKHIAECEECKKVLEKMNEKVALDIVQNKKEADYLEKAKRRQMLKNSIASIILFITVSAFIFICVFVTTCEYKVLDDNGKVDIAETMKMWLHIYDEDISAKRGKVSNIILKQKAGDSEHEGYYQTITIFSFDINTNICIGARRWDEGYSLQENIQKINTFEQLEEALEDQSPITDSYILNGYLIYSENIWVGQTKSEILRMIQNLEDYEYYEF